MHGFGAKLAKARTPALRFTVGINAAIPVLFESQLSNFINELRALFVGSFNS
jgi:hypothetical protein